MKTFKKLMCVLALSMPLGLVNARAACAISGITIAQWTFETSFTSIITTNATDGPLSPEAGSGSASGVHASSATAWSSPVGNGSPHSFSANGWAVGDYYQFQVNLSIYTNVVLAWDQASSSTGPQDFVLQYSTDGVNFSGVGTYMVLANTAHGIC